MTRVGIDTNVVISFLTDRDAAQQARAASLLSQATAGEVVVVMPQAVVLESVYLLQNFYEIAPHRTARTLEDLLTLPGVGTADEVDWPTVWRVWPGQIRDFGDACMAGAARAGTFDRLATFDASFASAAGDLGIPTYW